MKRTLLTALVAIVAILSAQTVQAQNHKSLPENAKNYLARHFKDCTINHHEKDADILNVEHKVYITYNGVSYQLEFDKQGNVTEISSTDDKTPLPASVIPVKISSDVKKRFPNAKIIEWSKDRGTQTIELDNGVELEYNRKGDFLRVDD